jgi:hypothetical protein
MKQVGLVIATVVVSGVALAHDSWINQGRYTNGKTGELCCGDNDCEMVREESVKVTSGGYLLAGGELVPFDETMKSEDGHYWRCHRHDPGRSRRCFFAPEQAS